MERCLSLCCYRKVLFTNAYLVERNYAVTVIPWLNAFVENRSVQIAKNNAHATLRGLLALLAAGRNHLKEDTKFGKQSRQFQVVAEYSMIGTYSFRTGESHNNDSIKNQRKESLWGAEKAKVMKMLSLDCGKNENKKMFLPWGLTFPAQFLAHSICNPIASISTSN